jgi:integrase
MMRLTDRTVARLALAAGKVDRIHFDGDLAGFGYRLRRGAGSRMLRSWVVQYRHAGIVRRYLIGSAEAIGAEQARVAAKKILAKVALGEDPQAARGARRDRDRLTFRTIAVDYVAARAPALRPKTLRDLRWYLQGPHFRTLHGAPLDRIGRKEIAACLVIIERERGTPTALRARAALSSLFVWAMRSGLTDANPVANTPKPAIGGGRDRVLSDDELGAIWRACGDDDHGRIVKLLILCGSRRAEIGGLCWSELDFDAGVWTLPSARSKNKRPHTLAIMPAMRAIIDQVPRRVARDQVFGERGAGGFAGWTSSKSALDTRSGVRGWVLHDIRRSVATGMANLNVQPHIIEEVLGHSSGHKAGVAGIYNKATYAAAVRAALATWHDHIRVIVAGGGARKVLPFVPQ